MRSLLSVCWIIAKETDPACTNAKRTFLDWISEQGLQKATILYICNILLVNTCVCAQDNQLYMYNVPFHRCWHPLVSEVTTEQLLCVLSHKQCREQSCHPVHWWWVYTCKCLVLCYTQVYIYPTADCYIFLSIMWEERGSCKIVNKQLQNPVGNTTADMIFVWKSTETFCPVKFLLYGIAYIPQSLCQAVLQLQSVVSSHWLCLLELPGEEQSSQPVDSNHELIT